MTEKINQSLPQRQRERWVDLAILNFCIVAFLGVLLRSKILFSMPWLNYNRLLDGHFHFAFGGWVTLALMTLIVSELLPEELQRKQIYQWLLGGIALSSWLLLLIFPFESKDFGTASNSFSGFFILMTYVFSWIFIKDLRKSAVSKTVFLLVVSSVVCLVFSSTGIYTLIYLFAVKSLNPYLYRDALYTYLHFQYNGFFTLAVFALFFHKLEGKITLQAKRNIYLFSVLLCISVLPSLFLSYLWQDPNRVFRLIAITGSVFLLLSFFWFLVSAVSVKETGKILVPVVKYMGLLSMAAFGLKIFLQSFTLFPFVGNAVFGDRPVIIGFLHLVFLGFVSLFILAYFTHKGYLNPKQSFTKFALVVFTTGVILNEAVLMTQGLGAMFIKSSSLFPYLLWAISIFLFTGTVFIGVARIRSKA